MLDGDSERINFHRQNLVGGSNISNLLPEMSNMHLEISNLLLDISNLLLEISILLLEISNLLIESSDLHALGDKFFINGGLQLGQNALLVAAAALV